MGRLGLFIHWDVFSHACQHCLFMGLDAEEQDPGGDRNNVETKTFDNIIVYLSLHILQNQLQGSS